MSELYICKSCGKVVKVEPGHAAVIEYKGLTLKGIIGFGNESYGKLKVVKAMKSYVSHPKLMIH